MATKTVKFDIELDASGAIKGVKGLDDQIEKLDDSIKDVDKSTGNYRDAQGKLRNENGKYIKDAKRATTANDELGGSFDKLGIKGVALGSIVSELATRAFDMFIQGLKNSINVGMEFQSALAELSAITGIAGDDLTRLAETANQQAILTGVSANDQIEAYKLLASNIDVAVIGGVAGLEMLGEATVQLAQASGVDLATAANTVAGAINQFGLEASQASDIVNILAAGSKFGAAEVGDLGESLKNVGTVASISGLSLEDTVGTLEVLSQRMLKGAEAGTGLRNILLRLQAGSAELAELGITPATLKTQGLAATMALLEPIMDDTQQMTKIFGKESIAVATALAQSSDQITVMTERVTDTSTALEQATVNSNTLEVSVNKLKAALTKLQTDGFMKNEDGLIKLTDAVTDLVNLLDGPLFKVLNKIVDNWIQTAQAVNLATNRYSTFTDRLIGLYLFLNPFADTLDATHESLMRLANAKEIDDLYNNLIQSIDNDTAAMLANNDVIDDSIALEKERLAMKEAILQMLMDETLAMEIASDKLTESSIEEMDFFMQLLDLKEQALQDNIAAKAARQDEEAANIKFGLIDSEIAKKQELIAANKTVADESIKSAKLQSLALIAKDKLEKESLENSLANNLSTIESLDDVKSMVLDSIKQQIQANIALSIASQIGNVVKTIPFPLNLAVIPLAAAGLSLLMNKLIPSFETGGMIGGQRHSAGGTLIEAEQGEFVLNRNSTSSAPNLIEAINSSATMASQMEQAFSGSTRVPDNSSLGNMGMSNMVQNIKVTLSLFDLDQGQRQFNQVQIQGGVL